MSLNRIESRGGRTCRWALAAAANLLLLQLLGLGLRVPVVEAQEATYEVLHEFNPFAMGSDPSALIRAADGRLIGTAGGGQHGAGILFQYEPGVGYTILHSFAEPVGGPVAALIQGTDGSFYGTTGGGGANHLGTIFQFEPGAGLTVLYSFSETHGDLSSFIQGSDGSFFGTTMWGGASNLGTIFRFEPGVGLTTLHSFSGADGQHPLGTLIQGSDGSFFGTTHGDSVGGTVDPGTIFRFEPGAGLTTLYSFADVDGSVDGARPWALVQGMDGVLYGTTAAGGEHSQGTIFRLEPGVGLTVLHSFLLTDTNVSPEASLIQGTDGSFYGTTYVGGDHDRGTIFRFEPGAGLTILHSFAGADGQFPRAGLIQGTNGLFYGATPANEENQGGTIFQFEAGVGLTTLYSFADAFDGTGPTAALVQATDATFYGTTWGGGAHGGGTIYQYEPGVGLTTLHSFAGADGAYPRYAAPIQATDGSLYGTTPEGGADNRGTIYQYQPGVGLTILHSFAGADGAYPRTTLIQGTDSSFYGTTNSGGANDLGTIFRFELGAGLTNLHSFASADGISPSAALLQGTDGSFYGTTSGGGANDLGTIFRFELGAGLTNLHSFASADGISPSAALLQGADGSFYGTTSGGGANNLGTIFRFEPGAGLTVLYSFAGANGAVYTGAALIQGIDDGFYGTTASGGSHDLGTIFQFEPGVGLTTLHSVLGPAPCLLDCPGSDRRIRFVGLIKGTDGLLYGTTSIGGWGQGAIFRFRPRDASASQRPGDCNLDGTVDISDAICLFGYLFLGSPAALPCGDGTSADPANRELFDWNGDGTMDLSDGIALLSRLFLIGPQHALGGECRAATSCPGVCEP